VLESAAKLTAVWAGSCGVVVQSTGHQTSMLRVSRLPSPHFFVVVVLATLSTRRGRLRGGQCDLAERDNVVLLAKRKTGMWTHVMFSLTPFREVLWKW
jgi:hypothetical protein